MPLQKRFQKLKQFREEDRLGRGSVRGLIILSGDGVAVFAQPRRPPVFSPLIDGPPLPQGGAYGAWTQGLP